MSPAPMDGTDRTRPAAAADHVEQLARDGRLDDAVSLLAVLSSAEIARLAASSEHPGDPALATALTRSADAVLNRQPALAGELYERAVAEGADPVALAARRAQAAAATGDLDEAGRLADALLAVPDAPELQRAVDVAAAVWAQRGMLDRSRDLYRWFGLDRLATSRASAIVAAIGVGDPAMVDEIVRGATPVAAPTSATHVGALVEEGMLGSIRGEPEDALAALLRASDLATAAEDRHPTPVSPAALAGLVALHRGDLDDATGVLEAAIAREQGGRAARAHLLLVAALADLRADRLTAASERCREAAVVGMTPRDEFLAAAVRVGVARRSDDAPGLVAAWERARRTVLHVPVDLYTVLALGELLVAAARLREHDRLRRHVADAWALLERLGEPPLWCDLLHWAGVQAAILLERPAELAPHAAGLVRAAESSDLAAVLAGAGRVWLSVLAGEVDPARVEAAGRALARVGLPWDGSRLAGHAAARAADRRDMTRLLSVARQLRHGGDPATAPRADADGHRTQLTPREQEVGRLVLEGKTYREIGAAMFVSPRTAEHHIAQIRRRLGASSRSELLVRLRVELAEHHVDGSGAPMGENPRPP